MLQYITQTPSAPAVAASEIVVAHVELVFAGLDEDETGAFRCRLPDLGGDCQ